VREKTGVRRQESEVRRKEEKKRVLAKDAKGAKKRWGKP
jgi:hypothetical protein